MKTSLAGSKNEVKLQKEEHRRHDRMMRSKSFKTQQVKEIGWKQES